MNIQKTGIFGVFSAILGAAALCASTPVFPNSDFETGDLTNWTASGDAFKNQPTQGDNSLARKREPAKPQGKFWIGTFENNPKGANTPGGKQGDKPQGKLVSQEFPVTHKYLTFLIGAGRNPSDLFVEIFVDGNSVKKATGHDSETMRREAVDMRPYQGKTARIEIVDKSSGRWGHINADDFRWSDEDSAAANSAEATFSLKADKKYLMIPVANPQEEIAKNAFERLTISVDGEPAQTLNVYLPESEADIAWWAHYPLRHWQGQKLTLKAEHISPAKESMLRKIHTSDTWAAAEEDYKEPYRNQFHFSQRRGWNNDVNGLYYRNGVWHLFWQHNPVGIYWQNMHWGHATSTDLVHWQEHDMALFQNGVEDMMYSGTGFVDKNNSSGVDPSGRGADFLAFTSTGRGECLAYSIDNGKTWKEVDNNPVVKHKGRDPKVFWHEPTQKWVMVVYDEAPTHLKPEGKPPFRRQNLERHSNREGINFAVYSSADLKNWKLESNFTMPDRSTVYECPDLIELPIEGEPDKTKWVIFGVMNFYHVGDFDGKTFTPMYKESFTGVDERCRAAIVFDNAPDNRKVMIGWTGQNWPAMNKRWPDLKFSQGLTVPLELSLRRTPDGLRMIAYPVKELETLREKPIVDLKNPTFEQTKAALESLNGPGTKLLDIVIEYAQKPGAKLALTSDGTGPDTRGEFQVNKDGQPFTPSTRGELRMLVDSALVDCYLDKGLRVSLRNKPVDAIGTTNLALAKEGDVQIKSLVVYPVQSIWKK